MKDILLIIGTLTAAISGLLSWIRARDDEDIDKEDIMLHRYIFAYPIYTVLMFIGALLIFIGMI
jgi:succinate-acetate transporter protein